MNIDTQKSSIHYDEAIVGCGSEVFAETDIILPQNCPDISRVLQIDAAANITEKEAGGDKVILRGEVEFTIIYIPDPQMSDFPVKSIKASANFTDVCEANGVTGDMKIRSIADVTAVNYSLVNSRKLSVKSTVHTEIKALHRGKWEFVTDAEGDIPVETLKNEVNAFCQQFDSEFDISVSDKLEIPSGKPAAAEILKISANVSECDVKLLADKCILKGVCTVNTLYVSRADMSLEFMEHEIPFTEVFETPGALEDMDTDTNFTVVGIYHETDEDDNGIHTLGVEINLLVNINISGEQTATILSDCFSPCCELLPSRSLCKIDRIEKTANPQISVKGELYLGEDYPPIARICNISHKPVIEKVTRGESSVKLEGILKIDILYITADAETPICNFKGSLPFMHSVSVDSCTDFIVDCSVHSESCSYTLSDDLTVSIRATAEASVKIICNDTINLIDDIKISESEKKQKSPIVIYFVQPEDTMWSVAKKYKTPIEKITSCNNISLSHSLTPGTKLVIPTT